MIELDVIDADQVKRDAEEDASKERFWRSYGDLQNDPAHREIEQNEFMEGASQPPSGTSRRDFMKLMGASMALAGLSACRQPVDRILPYTRKPEDVIEGVPRYFATAMPFRGALRGLLVENHDGRPTKVEGNPEHPASLGATSPFEQASVLNLYDPDRSRRILRDGSESSWSDFLNFCGQLTQQPDLQVTVLCEETSSVTVQSLREQLSETYSGLQWITYAPEGDDPVRIGMQEAYGQPYRPLYDFSEAEVIVSLDADFLAPMAHNFVRNTRTFADSRRLEGPEDDMSRLYVVESDFSTTGGMADNRLRMRPTRVASFAAALAEAMGVAGGAAPDVQFSEREQRYIEAIAEDLQQAGAGGVVLAGETQPPAVHALCMAINEQIGSTGELVTLLDTEEEPRPPQAEALQELVAQMQGGDVDALVMIGVNPVYDLPEELGFQEALRGVEETVHLGLHVDETARACRWHLPRAHYLEAWGDGRSYDGTLSVIQPLIAPLYEEAHSEIEVLNALATGLDESGYDLVRQEWNDRIEGEDFERGWRRVLHDGFLPDSAFAEAGVAGASAEGLDELPASSEDELELVFRLDPKVLSGEFSNNAWMQELPAPTTKITWDNVAVMSRQTAEELGLDVRYDSGQFYSDVVALTFNGQRVELPVWIQPGYPDGTIGVTFGYGREVAATRPRPGSSFWDFANAYTGIYERDPVANDVGTNVGPLRSAALERVAVGVEVEPAGREHMIVSTQEHGSMEGRPIARRASLEDFRERPDFATEMGEPSPTDEPFEGYPELWAEDHPQDRPPHQDSPYYQNQWGMVIDLGTCTGCNACVVACQSENNVQVVGKDQVAVGREMHWLRLDRYYISEEDSPEEADMIFQPMLCQHCDNAPCESVCPVAATSQSPDGINEMTYNRCIGTRYCSNNCPYKVRRFNFFNWSKSLPLEVQMTQNPDVTVRNRGVMEKCTFCVQRVRQAQEQARIEDRTLEDGEVVTACQQACPARAIEFGDLNNADSEVVRQRRNPRRYELLAYLNTKPRLSYLGRVSNPNPRLREAEEPTR